MKSMEPLQQDLHSKSAPQQVNYLDNNSGASKQSISVVVPVYNEEESIELLYRELVESLNNSSRSYEIVFVNDGSSDDSAAILDRIAASDPAVVVIHFRRNQGQTAALMAAMDHSTGAIIVPIDADLQNDPADIPALVEKLESGFDVVSGWRRNRQDKALSRKLPSTCANWLISRVSGVRLHDYGCSLKAYRREVIEGVRLYGEMHRFVPIYAEMHGGRIHEMEVNHRPRRFGTSKYGLNRVFKVLLDLMLVKFLNSYASKPIYLFGGFGMICLMLSLVTIGGSIFFKVMPVESGLHKDFVETPLPIVASMLILVSMLALLQGLLAEMLMRTYHESQGKPPYLVHRITHQPSKVECAE